MAETPFEAIFRALEEHEVCYLVVGGFAVVLHGYLRATAGLDLVLALEPENVKKACEAFSELGFRPRPPVQLWEFADAARRKQWLREKGLTVFSLWSPKAPGVEVNLFVEEPFDFGEVFRRSSAVRLTGVSARVISLEDLIEMKKKTGRPIDGIDVEALEAIRDAGKR